MQHRVFSIVRWASAAAIFFVFFYVALRAVDPDLGWHIKVGEWIASNHAVPRVDIYSHTMPGFPWVDHEWLVDLWLWWMYARGYEMLAAFLFACAATIPFWVWLWRAKSYLGTWLVLIAAYGTTGFLGVRPQILSFLFFFIVYELVCAYKKRRNEGRPAHRFLLALIPIFILWANLHAGFVSGLVLFAIVFGIDHAVLWWRSSKIGKAAVFEISVLFASFAGTFLNPYGYGLYKLIFEALFSPETSKYIAEWASAFSVVSVPNMVLAAFFVFLSAMFFRRYVPSLLGATAFFFLMFLRSIRMWFFFVVPAIPLFALGIQYAGEEIEKAHQKNPFGPRARGALFGGIVALFLTVFGAIGYNAFRYEPFQYPEKAAVFLKDEVARGASITILNDYGWGGYLIEHIPEMKVFIDGRMPHWVDERGASAMRDYIKIFYTGDRDERREIFERRNINTILIKTFTANESTSTPFVAGVVGHYLPRQFLDSLRASETLKKAWNGLVGEKKNTDLTSELLEAGWSVVYEDKIATVFRCNGTCYK